jgi:hypothetical protein
LVYAAAGGRLCQVENGVDGAGIAVLLLKVLLGNHDRPGASLSGPVLRHA